MKLNNFKTLFHYACVAAVQEETDVREMWAASTELKKLAYWIYDQSFDESDIKYDEDEEDDD